MEDRGEFFAQAGHIRAGEGERPRRQRRDDSAERNGQRPRQQHRRACERGDDGDREDEDLRVEKH